VKEIISAVAVIVGIWAGTRVLTDFYDSVRKAALEKASHGLPSLTQMNHKLHQPAQARPSQVKNKTKVVCHDRLGACQPRTDAD
jgi:hypothetical protein